MVYELTQHAPRLCEYQQLPHPILCPTAKSCVLGAVSHEELALPWSVLPTLLLSPPYGYANPGSFEEHRVRSERLQCPSARPQLSTGQPGRKPHHGQSDNKRVCVCIHSWLHLDLDLRLQSNCLIS